MDKERILSLEDIFTDEVIERLSSTVSPSTSLKTRLDVITARGGSTKDSYFIQSGNARAFRSSWDTYITAASKLGMISSKGESDIAQRLTSRTDTDFRSAISECMAVWFFGGRLKWPITPHPAGKGKSVLEFSTTSPDGEINIEVKSPYREQIGGRGSGNDYDLIQQSLVQANTQFAKGKKNVLVIVPELRSSIASGRYQLIQALIGQPVIVVPVANLDND